MSQPRIEGYYGFSDEKTILVNILKRKLRPSYSSILDVGAGNGVLSQILYERTNDLHLCEINPFYEKSLRESLPKAQIEIKDVNNLNLKSYEMVFFSQGLYYHSTQHWRGIVSRLMDSLTPGGELVLILNKNEGDWWDAIRSVWEVRPEQLAFSYLPSDQFISIISNDCKAIDIETFIYNLNFSNTEERDHYLRKSCIPLLHQNVETEKLIANYIDTLGSRLNFQYFSEVITLRK
ncbi:MAG: class I SAM-dependent methyltransferase [Bdellovibrionaceae bacterium]|nr:class I SAM-dependent methyltransferase [Pseudobdellovibrionaceae bacterium]